MHPFTAAAEGPVRVLVAEDDPVSRHRLQMVLGSWGYDVTSVADGGEALRRLQQQDRPNLVILDWSMPQLDGIEVCQAVRAMAADCYVYVILLTARDRGEDMIAGFDAGADDYIVKPFDTRELKARVRSGARIVQLHQQLIAAQEQLREKAMHDPLTGLLTRGAFFELYDRELLKAKRTGTPLAIIMADLDHFKAVNDRYGHLAGDDVLREAARRLASTFRRSDAVGRYGGEEFVTLAVGCGVTDALMLAERFRASVGTCPFDTSAGPVRITTSVGVVSTNEITDVDQLLKAADDALYRAKSDGRDRVVAGARAA